MSNILSVPLDFPIVEPDDWDEWWRVWDLYCKPAPKINLTHNPGPGNKWEGFIIYKKPEFVYYPKPTYNFEYHDVSYIFTKFFSNLEKFPIDIDLIKATSSYAPVAPHNEWPVNPQFSARAMLYDTNPISTWYYVCNGKTKFQKLPPDTNTWLWDDSISLHGTTFIKGYRKILLIFEGQVKDGQPEKAFTDSKKKYEDYIIYI